MEESSRSRPPPPGMEFMDSMRIPGPSNAPPDVMNMFNFIDSIDPPEPVNNGGTAQYITREQRMYAAEYCRLQDKIDTLSKEKEQLKDKVSRCEQKLLKAREPREASTSAADKALILELKRSESTLQSKLTEQKNQFEQIKSQLEIQTVKVREQAEVIEKYKGELDEATTTVLEREQEINEYRSVVASQKVMLEKNEEKISEHGRHIDKLEKEKGNLQEKMGQKEEAVSSMQDKLSALEDSLKTKQNEVKGMKQSLEKEKKDKMDAEASFMKLQKSSSNFNLEFSQFIDELKTVSNYGEEESLLGPTTDTVSLQKKLELLVSSVKNKFQSLQNSQKMAKEESARIKQVVFSLKLMLDSQKPRKEAQATQSTQTELSEPSVPNPTNVNGLPSAVETTSIAVPKKPSYSSAVQVQAPLTREANALVPQNPQSAFPADNFEFPALIPPLSNLEIDTADITCISDNSDIDIPDKLANRMARGGSSKTHGVDSSKSHLGLFCLCGQKSLSLKSLNGHIQYFTREWKFKCKLCSTRFYNLVNLNRHMVKSHRIKNAYKKGWSGCTACGQEFPSRKKLYQHKKTVHTVQTSRKTLIRRTLSKLKSEPMKKSLSDNVANTNPSADDVPTISLKKGKSRSRCSLWNVVSNENDSSHSMMWESFDKDDTEHEKDKNANDDNATKTNKPSASKFVADNPRHGIDNSKEGPGYFCFCGYHHPFDENRLLNHIRYFTADPKFSCNLCGKRCVGSNYLRRHYRQVHKITCVDSVGCWKCGEEFENRKLLIKHQKSIHGRRRGGSRPVAPTSQDNQPSTSSADKTSNDNALKTSDFENKSARGFKIIINHHKLLSRNGNKLPILCVCGYKAKNEDCFRKHVKYYAKKFHFICDVCDKGFKTTSNLRGHMQSAHQMNYNRKGCRLCGKVFETLEKLRFHQFVQHSNRMEEDRTNASSALTSEANPELNTLLLPPSENSAGASFSSAPASQSPKKSISPKTTYLIIPQKRKHGVDLSKRNLGYYCICGTKRSDRKSLNQHIHYFTAEHKFQCKHCSLKFLHLARLKAHTKRRHKNANLEDLGTVGCSDCGLTFHSHLDLFQHRKIHSSIEGASNSSLFPDAPAPTPESGINALNSLKGDRTISSLTVTKATPQTISPALLNKARRTPHAVNPQSQSHPQAKSASTASSASSAHKPVRFGKWKNLVDVHYCMCGIQFETDFMLRRHILEENENALSVEDQSCVESVQVCTPPSHSNSNSAVEATPEKRNKDNLTQAEATPMSLSHIPPSSSTSTKSNIIRIDKSRPLTHAIDKSKEKVGLGLFCMCGMGFISTLNMGQHFQFHRNGRKFSCEQCERKFKEMSELNKHIKAKHGCNMTKFSQFGCRFCGQVFSSGQQISKHRTKILTSAGKLMKVFCPSRMLDSTNSGIVHGSGSVVQQAQVSEAGETLSLDTTTMESYEVSLDSLINNTVARQLPSITIRSGNSSEIDVETNQQRNLLEPQLIPPESEDSPTHGIDTSKSSLGFICFCGQRCVNKPNLKKHIKRFTAERKFICKTCKKGFLAPSLLQRHMRGVHKVVSNASIGCQKCGELFPTNMELYHHFRIVHNYGCSWEPRELKYTPSVPSLAQDSSQEEPISVQTDPTAAANGNEGTAPEAHTVLPVDPLAENKVYQCSCGKPFFTRSGLNNHVRIKKFGKIFQCPWCSHRCDVHGNLKSHVRQTHKMEYQNLKFACGVCAQTFASLDEVTKHRRTTHENQTKKVGNTSSSSGHGAMEQ